MLLTKRKPTLPREPRSAISNTTRSASSTISRASRTSGSRALVTIPLPAVMSCRRTDRSRTMSAYEPMVVAVEVLGDHTIRDLVPGGGIEHQTAQHRLLGLDRMGRQAEPLAASARTQDSISDASRHAKPARRGFAGRYSSAT